MRKKKTKKSKPAPPLGETTCHVCGARVLQSGPNAGQCSNQKCKAEHTRINPLPDNRLSWNEYKDYYG